MYQILLEKVFRYFTEGQNDLDKRRVWQSFHELDGWKYKDVQAELAQKAMKTIWTKNQFDYIKLLSEKFNDKIIFMKGILLSWELYGDITKRVGSDIDILVRNEDVLDIGNLLIAEGFSCDVDRERWCAGIKKIHLTFVKEIPNSMPITIEMHEEPAYYLPYRSAYLEDVWKRAEHMPVQDISPLVMDVYDRIVYYLLHYFKHTCNFEIYALIGNGGSLKVKNLLDIYLTMKMYDISTDVLLERLEASGRAWECKEVMLLLHDIFGDICSKEFLVKLEDIGVRCDTIQYCRWRYEVPLHLTIAHYLKKDYFAFVERYLKCDYSRALKVKERLQYAFKYEDDNIEIACGAQADGKVKIVFDITRKAGIELEHIRFGIHYHEEGKLDKAYLRNMVIRFAKKEDGYVCLFKDEIMGQVYEVDYSLSHEGRKNTLWFYIPKEMIKNKWLTYSVNCNYSDVWSVCVSGTRWEHFATMHHLRLEE